MDSALTFDAELYYYERALSDAKGLRIPFGTYGDANQQRLRLHKARRLDRKMNKEIYAPGEQFHGRSVYDGLVCRIRADEENRLWYVYIEHSTAGEPENLSDVVEVEYQAPEKIEYDSPKMIEYIPRRKLWVEDQAPKVIEHNPPKMIEHMPRRKL